jgi:3-oxoacyl-[acyl-carrier protein] reductase
MKKQKSGKVILFSGSGIGGEVVLDNVSSYLVSKGALVFLAQALAEELASFNIAVNAILPGRILTESTKAIFGLPEKKIGKVMYEAVKELKKGGGQSMESVTNLVLFLCSTKSKSLTGKLLSARWDSLSDLSGSLPIWKYTLKRIEGKNYKKILI